jgi:ubiquinone/menaquinone biosynthesis C-methylase UbiE
LQNKERWEKIYSTKAADGVSWYLKHADLSIRFIHETGVDKSARIIDVGGGTSVLVDNLLNDGYNNLSVLDLSGAALATARERLGENASNVNWIEGDITKVELPHNNFDVWHDRAVFHFLTSLEDRQKYVRTVMNSVKENGHIIIATFAEDGPTKCSGLPVIRYSADELHKEFGDSFSLLSHDKEAHSTPFGTVQQFVYCYCRMSTI